MPADGEYVPADDAETHDAPGPESYDPSVPAPGDYDGEGDYDPSRPAEGDYAPEDPAYDPSRPADGEYEQPEEGPYDPSGPAGGDYASAPAEEEGVVEGGYDATAPEEGYDAPREDSAPANGTPAPDEIPADTGAEPKVPLPEGLTDDSPSVAHNYDLVRQWRHDPSDQALLLWLFNWAVDRSEAADARAWYAALAVDNPTASGPMLALINLELSLSNFKEVEDLFSKALSSADTLKAAADINIWKAYLHYIRRQNPTDGADAEAARTTVTQAYEYALKECGVDRESGEIWQEYITYLGENKTRNPWEQQQISDNIRKIYQRAVAIPLNNVEALWKNYDAFESAQSKVAAKKYLADRSPAYMTARTALRECRQHTDSLPRPELPPFPNFSDGERRVVGAWRNYIKWEEGNPLQSDDASLVVQRTDYALHKCMAQMRHFPELWHYAATYHLNAGRADEGAAYLRAGVAACPKSFLLSFALAELEEDRKNHAECHKIFEALISSVNAEVDELQASVAAEVERARGPEIPAQPGEMDGEESDIARMVRERDERGKRVQERRGRDIDAARTAAGTAWVMYMRFARRSEGLKAARLVFGKARKSPHITWHVFQASALMEYYSNKDSSVAVRIFELGVRQFSDEVPFVIGYLEFLLSINDDTNARALFERSALKIPPAQARPLWETWARFEYMHGDLAAVHKLEARWATAFPSDSPLKRFAQRHTYAGVDEIALRDLGLRARQAGAPALAAPARTAAPVPPAAPRRPLPPHMARPPVPPFPPRTASPLPSSPAKRDRSPPRSPRADAKRARPASPPRRFGPPAPVAGGRSPVPPPRGRGPHPPPGSERDRSGLPKAVSWFVGTLPPARSFDGPVFRPDDIMGLFSNISPAGLGVGIGVGGPVPPRPPMPPARPPARFAPGRRY
ncbi:uncharacterized protein COLE_04687 [Cutaneotrichosporon oleaginosum]|nr:hypothetical protein COLE_04687 [Cutaneotrichosporon oleaginosum]